MKRCASIMLLLSILFSCRPSSEPEKKEAAETLEKEENIHLSKEQAEAAGIVLGKIIHRNLSQTLTVNGMLDVPPQNLVSISAMLGGFVKSTQLLQGMRVKKGQVLAIIQNGEFIKIQREYLENKQRLEFLEQEFHRQKELMKEDVAAKREFQQVSSEYNMLKTAIHALEEQLRMLNINPSSFTENSITSTSPILSPIDGYVTTVNVNLGKFVHPQDVICEIVNTEHLHAELTVFEKDIPKIKKGQKVRFVLVNEGAEERLASIYLINHKIESDRTVRVHAHLQKDDPTLVPNMYLKAVIELGDQKVTALPDEAIVTSAGKNYIFKAINKTEAEFEFMPIEVKTGVKQHGFTEVHLPFDFDNSQSTFVIKGTYSVLSKMANSEEEEGHGH